MRLLPATLAASLLALALATPARAGGPPGSVPNLEPVTPTHVERYGKQILLADLLWLGGTALITSAAESGNNGDDGIAPLLYLGYYATGPLIHLKHGNRSGAAKSLAARALLPLGGLLVGGLLAANSVDNTDDNPDDLFDGDEFAVIGGMVLGALVGSVSAMVLDWTVFSRKTVEGRPASWAMAPNVAVTKHGASVGLAGSF